ncbi:VWA domain-containing protein [Rufibacter glacialis]|uniref:VWA domain-containing protein n=1 Tax=Rufibacter glacialis TaxID=1259555 RepID=A0A5M8QAX5_9BACT|nr:VWA domain-containing protein [Rufibacter glacialis]KAA6431682.1 VWA domain-containing protein [Rufibacter glacialis]GGK82473.1 aerotolerance regulator BatB [Rufibacter glacialis]
MTWYLPFTSMEFFFLLLFGVLYGGYLYRIKRLARQFSQTANTIWIKAVIRSIYMGLLVVALLGPSFGAMTKEIRTNGKDVYLAVDLSQSMKALDVPPARLEKVKLELLDFIKNTNADRVGLIGFSSEAFVLSPLTYDQGALELFVQALSTNLAPPDAAQLTPVLELAHQKFKDSESSRETERSKILVIFSDGETFGERIESATLPLQNQGVRVFCVGVGSYAGGKIPVGRTFKKDQEGQTVLTKLEPEALQRIAKRTQGNYFEINQNLSEMPRLLSAVNAVKSELRQTKVVEVAANKYLYPLLAALLLIAFDVLWTLQVLRI